MAGSARKSGIDSSDPQFSKLERLSWNHLYLHAPPVQHGLPRAASEIGPLGFLLCVRPAYWRSRPQRRLFPVSYTHLRAHETDSYLVCRLLLEKKKKLK